MSYLNEKELADKEREDAEIVASNEYQKELDEGLPHIEVYQDFKFVGTMVFDEPLEEHLVMLNLQKIQEAVCKAIEKYGEKPQFYKFKKQTAYNLETGKFSIIVKGIKNE